jgi:V8-like Glu-specific endopeptidase
MPFSIEAGLKALKQFVPQDDSEIGAEFQTYEARLLENLQNERLFGGTDTTRSARASIIYSLNPLALKLTGVSFNDLCQGIPPIKPLPQPAQPVVAPPPVSSTPKPSTPFPTDIVVDIIARQAQDTPVDPKQYFRYLVSRTDLPTKWKQDIAGVWTGSIPMDARRLVDFALSKGTNPENKSYTALGSILKVLLRDDLGLEDSATLAAIIVAYRQYRTNELLNELALRYQIPSAPVANIAAPDYGPDISWHGPTDDLELQSFFQEPPDFLAISFLKRAIQLAASVCKLDLPSLQRTGTGFLVTENLLLTNYHVLQYAPNEDIDANARDLILRFGYFSDTSGGGDVADGRMLKLADDNPIVDRSPINELDYVLLRVEDAIMVGAGDIGPLKEFELNPPARYDNLHILQHPAGKTMQLAPSSNGVTSVDTNSNLIQYITRALGGSSGAPCFDEQWRLVALHHAERSKGFGKIREGVLFGPIYQRIRQYL